MKTVRDLLISLLKMIDADGLSAPDCGCGIDDLAPCDCLNLDKCCPAKFKNGRYIRMVFHCDDEYSEEQ